MNLSISHSILDDIVTTYPGTINIFIIEYKHKSDQGTIPIETISNPLVDMFTTDCLLLCVAAATVKHNSHLVA